MRFFMLFLCLVLSGQIANACPSVKDVKFSLPDIYQSLKHPEMDIIIKGVNYHVQPKGDKEGLMDLLNGNFEGFILDRLKETAQGECLYRVRDDQTTVSGKFVLRSVSTN